jgi:hypothetical protein
MSPAVSEPEPNNINDNSPPISDYRPNQRSKHKDIDSHSEK